MLREKLRNKKGFTLIEIIVVIVILAVLMAVAVPSVMSYMNEGQKAKYEAVARTVLINTQTEYANEVANGSYSFDTAKTNIAKKNYGDGVTVAVTKIDLTAGESGSSAAEDQDVKSVTATITIDEKTKTATIAANKKVTLS
ncbi:hypothetical protein SG0102_16890 [Intestinibaculum porci]|uniref:Prepilin-type N-terminal cleavage/methylation domain-containing protein n=1 Tax=Intestinibaculum porci TaxID=2487118 RepID=A0A3G9JEH0_9FIRM|nr:prepilin-type N-terminal cleavage/methylation domain-containing protein [Intestinibaculum porci]BBH26755.1 hypothetical protein SG0102_16890 [Intestinibaculum porci]